MGCENDGCNDCLDSSVVTIPTGNDGDPGAAGSDGLFGGFSAEWTFDDATSANPGATLLRFDNATLASVTKIYINDLNIDSVDHNDFLEAFKNNDGATDLYGLVKVWKQYDSTIFWMGEITNVVDNGADHTIDVTHVLSNGTFTDADDVVISFVPRGNTGAAGASGAADSVIFADHATNNTNSATYVSLASNNIPANSFSSDGDKVRCIINMTRTDTSDLLAYVLVKINGSAYTVKIPEWQFPVSYKELKIQIELTRKKSNSLFVDTLAFFKDGTYTVQGSNGFLETNLSGLTFSSAIPIAVEGKTDGAAVDVQFEQMTAELFTI